MISRTLVAIFLLAQAGFCLDVKALKPRGYVSDFANVLDSASAKQIEALATQLEQSTGVQIAIVTLPSLDDTSIENVATDLYHAWGIGKKGKDEGLLYLLSVGDRKQRIELGYGLEAIISDGFSGDILRSVRPSLARGDYGAAALSVTQQAAAKIAAEKGVSIDVPEVARPQRRRPQSHSLPWQILIPVALLFLWSLRGGGGGRGGGGFLTGLILGNLMGRGGGGGWSGGGFGGSDSGGGGFGGFGGGDSGGGGASSDW
ncbi:MAG: TPM domain-containing protein [Bryobacteraceae bacterium]